MASAQGMFSSCKDCSALLIGEENKFACLRMLSANPCVVCIRSTKQKKTLCPFMVSL